MANLLPERTVTAAEYRITGLPPEWVISVENTPAVATSVGNVFAEGTRLELDGCQSSSEYAVIHLQTLHVFATSVANHSIFVERALPPLNLLHDAPILESCTEQGSENLECYVSAFDLNGIDPYCGIDCWPAPCPGCDLVAVQQASWETLKQMYR